MSWAEQRAGQVGARRGVRDGPRGERLGRCGFQRGSGLGCSRAGPGKEWDREGDDRLASGLDWVRLGFGLGFLVLVLISNSNSNSNKSI